MEHMTDLALEARELASANSGEIEGVSHDEYDRYGIKIDKIEILDERGERALGKRKGTYITITLPNEEAEEDDAFKRCAQALSDELGEISADRNLLFAGLGNTTVTADSLGPLTADKIIVTRHVYGNKALPQNFGSVSAVKCGVMGQTGIESAEIIKGICDQTKPAVIVVADALTARSTERLSKTIQLSDCGISPGSGVGNTRSELSQDTMGIPVISVGVPTIVRGSTLIADAACEMCDMSREELYNMSKERFSEFYVTPKEIDVISERMSMLIAVAVNMFAHRMTYEQTLDMM